MEKKRCGESQGYVTSVTIGSQDTRIKGVMLGNPNAGFSFSKKLLEQDG